MTFASEPAFRVHHALRIKGFAGVGPLAELAALPADECEEYLRALAAGNLALFRENRSLWQLTPAGKEVHSEALEHDAGRPGFRDGLASSYPAFLTLNERLKELCTRWQLRDGSPNDHDDADYDAEVLDALDGLHSEAHVVASHFGVVAERFAAYASRLESSLSRLRSGQMNMFTGVLCGSYHDVWMELHEDLLLTQSINRSAEGSF
jgi:hypothetical protein